MRADAITIIGFGEAGQAFSRGWAQPRGRVNAFDIKTKDPAEAAPLVTAAAETGVGLVDSLADALSKTGLVIALVPTDEDVAATANAAPHVSPGTYWLDGSSSSPGRKRKAAALIQAAGAQYIDMAIMAPVHPRLHQTPVLLSGPMASEVLPVLQELGMVAEVAGGEIGQASAIKMIRSILIKGIEAVSAECLLAARRSGVEAAVLQSLRQSEGVVDWERRGSYNLERMTRHGHRRAAEMREVVTTLNELRIPSRMSEAAAEWQDQLGGLGAGAVEEGLIVQLDEVLAKLV